MINYLVIKLIANKSIYYPKPTYYDQVEIRTDKYDLPDEIVQFEESIKLNEEFIDLNFSVRLATIIQSDNEINALEIADKRFEEVLDILSSEGVISKFELKKSGIIKILETGEIKPIKDISNRDRPVLSFLVDGERYPSITLNEYIFYRNIDPLPQRYLNALHWTRLARFENNYQLILLFNWIAIETLIKFEKNNDDIVTKCMIAVGLPIGKRCIEYESDFLNKLQSYQNYRSFRSKIHKEFIEIRNFRNNSVHRGYRKIDIDINDLKRYCYLANNAKICLFRIYNVAIVNKISDENELWQKFINLIQMDANAINHCHNNFLFSYTRSIFI